MNEETLIINQEAANFKGTNISRILCNSSFPIRNVFLFLELTDC